MLEAGFETEGGFGGGVQDGGILGRSGDVTKESLGGDFHEVNNIVVSEFIIGEKRANRG